ncbi:hypothetical protein GFS31_25580 [Leptolyngbya sp. BL0902]|nr:hypothetical protein GFS31_25580 [Leptolyngbya sp. BL0902]
MIFRGVIVIAPRFCPSNLGRLHLGTEDLPWPWRLRYQPGVSGE